MRFHSIGLQKLRRFAAEMNPLLAWKAHVDGPRLPSCQTNVVVAIRRMKQAVLRMRNSELLEVFWSWKQAWKEECSVQQMDTQPVAALRWMRRALARLSTNLVTDAVSGYKQNFLEARVHEKLHTRAMQMFKRLLARMKDGDLAAAFSAFQQHWEADADIKLQERIEQTIAATQLDRLQSDGSAESNQQQPIVQVTSLRNQAIALVEMLQAKQQECDNLREDACKADHLETTLTELKVS